MDSAFRAINPPTMAINSTVVKDGRRGSGEAWRKVKTPKRPNEWPES